MLQYINAIAKFFMPQQQLLGASSNHNVRPSILTNGPLLGALNFKKIVSEYDQEIPHSQTADKPMAPLGKATQLSRGTRKTN